VKTQPALQDIIAEALCTGCSLPSSAVLSYSLAIGQLFGSTSRQVSYASSRSRLRSNRGPVRYSAEQKAVEFNGGLSHGEQRTTA